MICPFCGKDIGVLRKAIEIEKQVWRRWDNDVIVQASPGEYMTLFEYDNFTESLT